MQRMENEIKARKDRENRIKKIESDINSLKSDINKNLDVLNTYEEHKVFLSQLGQSSAHFQAMAENRQKLKAVKKKEWIDFYKKNVQHDNLIFRNDDEGLDSDNNAHKSRMNFNKMTPA